MINSELIAKHTEKIKGITLESRELQQLSDYANLISEWNKKFNLTAIKDDEPIAIKHIADSLYISETEEFQTVQSIVDTGCGAGLPGIPLAIVYKEKLVTLIESSAKKITFLKHVKETLGLDNITVLHGRSEDYSREFKYSGTFDCCVMRAFANFNIAMEITGSLVRKSGFIFYYSSKNQVSGTQKKGTIYNNLGMRYRYAYDYSLDNDMGEHSIIIVEKVWKTDKKYPREYSKIKKSPLK
jgi:16S rRNA (guanine527-N7)-methyltransferase